MEPPTSTSTTPSSPGRPTAPIESLSLSTSWSRRSASSLVGTPAWVLRLIELLRSAMVCVVVLISATLLSSVVRIVDHCESRLVEASCSLSVTPCAACSSVARGPDAVGSADSPTAANAL